jgi:hypothetical protein
MKRLKGRPALVGKMRQELVKKLQIESHENAIREKPWFPLAAASFNARDFEGMQAINEGKQSRRTRSTARRSTPQSETRSRRTMVMRVRVSEKKLMNGLRYCC